MRDFRWQIILLSFFLILSVLAGKWQTLYRNQGKIDPLSHSVQGVILPLATLVDQTVKSTSEFTDGVLHARALKAENLMLKNKLKFKELELGQSKHLQSEISRLQRVLNLKAGYAQKKSIAAEIVGFFPYEHRITLSAGSAQGVVPGLAVITPDGLLAVVQTVGETTSQANLITSPSVQIGATILRDPPYIGLIKGESSKTISMELLDIKAPVKVNDLVETSSISEKIPAHIPIGKVIQIESNPDFGVQKVRIFLNATVGKDREVLIIK